jgi:hypothetical protein
MFRCPAEDLDVLNVARRTDCFDLRPRLAAGADHSEYMRVVPRQVACGNAARRAGAYATQPVCLQDGEELIRLGVEEEDGEVGAGPA